MHATSWLDGRARGPGAAAPLLAAVAALATLGPGCSDDGSGPDLARVGEPLTIAEPPDAGPPTADAGQADGGPARAPAPTDPAADDGGVVARDPARAMALAAEADLAGARGDLARARALCRRAVRHDPEAPWLRVAWAWYLSRAGELAAARDELEGALDAADGQDPLLIAAIHLGLGELREARRDLVRARESYRAGLRAWSAPPLARALLRVTPPGSDQLRAVADLAFDGSAGSLSDADREAFASLARRGGPEVLALAQIEGRGLALVRSRPDPRDAVLAPGAEVVVALASGPGLADGGDGSARVSLGTAAAVRWQKATAQAVTLGPGRPALLVTVERTGPGAGAPLEAWTSVVALGDAPPRLEVVAARQTADERESPIGCRRGWVEEVTLAEGALRVTRRAVVRPRLPHLAGACPASSRPRPPETIPLR